MRKIIKRNDNGFVAASRRLRGVDRLYAAGLGALGLVSSATQVFAGTFSTSSSAPTGALMSNPDNTNTSLSGWQDYTNNFYGAAQVFTPTVNMTLDAVTVQGASSAGGTLSGAWNFAFGSVSQNWWGGAAKLLDYETGDGTPIATDVSNGVGNNYDTFNLSTPMKLSAGTQYFFSFYSPSGWYALAKAGASTSGGEAADLNTGATTPGSATSLAGQQGVDHTFYLLGTAASTNVASQWALNGSGAWETDPNWTQGAPSIAGDTATFDTYNGTITVSPTVTLSTPVTLDSMTFNASSISYTIANASAGAITLDTKTGNQVNVFAGNHSINAPVQLAGSTTFTISTGSSLTLADVTGGGYGTIIVAGGGALVENQIATTGFSLTVNGSTLTTLSTTAAPQDVYYFNVYNGAVLNLSETLNIWAGNFDSSATINLAATGNLQTDGTTSVNIASTIAGTGSIGIGAGPKSGVTTAMLTGTNSNFSGPISVSQNSTLTIGSDVNLGNGSATNTITLDNGTLIASSAFTGTHALLVTANGGTLNSGGFNIGLGSIAVASNGTLTIASQNAGGGVMTITAGSLNVSAGSTVNVATATAHSDKTVLAIGGLSLAGSASAWTGKVDLGGNDMTVAVGNIGTISNQIQQGYANGTWQGTGGIASAAAAADTTHLTALGSMQNGTGVLIKYTYYGDATLDGQVDSSDYTLIDNGYISQLTGWHNGDFNYDGVVNGSDYTLIDNAFNTQGAALSSQIATPSADATAQIAASAGTASVPEPASLGLFAISAAGLLGKRRRMAR